MVCTGLTTTIASGSGDEIAVAPADNLRLMGFKCQAAATPAAVIIRHGDGGEVLGVASLSPGSSLSRWLGPDGIPCGGGIHLERLAGKSAITLWTETA